MATTDTVIEVRGLRRRYGKPGTATAFDAVRGVDLTVHRGELFALLGTNGAGKTSLLEVVEGLAPPSAGTVRVLGADPLRDRAAVRPKLGIMLQEAGFPGDLTVAEVLGTWRGTLRGARTEAEVMAMVGLAARRQVRVASLSGGERRRLDLALAVMGHPEVLFLDEPTTGLDPESRRGAWQLIEDLLAGGTTIVLTTHYLEEAERLAHRLAIMHAGRVATEGTVAELVAAAGARVSFRPPAEAGALPAFPVPVEVEHDTAGRTVLRTTAPQAVAHAVLRWADQHGLALDGFDVRSASLEQAFLDIAAESTPDPIEQEAAA